MDCLWIFHLRQKNNYNKKLLQFFFQLHMNKYNEIFNEIKDRITHYMETTWQLDGNWIATRIHNT